MACLSSGITGWLRRFFWFVSIIWLNQTTIRCFVAEPWTVSNQGPASGSSLRHF